MPLPGLLRLDPARLAPRVVPTGPDADPENDCSIIEDDERAIQPPPNDPDDQDAVSPWSGPTPQCPNPPMRWSQLDDDVKDEIRNRVFDFGDAYEKSSDPDANRVGVPDPLVIRKDHWRPDDNALALCHINKANDVWCKRLVQVTCERERAYWEARQPSVDFKHVLAAIRMRDGAIVDEDLGDAQHVESDEPGWMGDFLSRANAVSVIVRARYWYPKYADRNRQTFEDVQALALATRIVTVAQLLVEWQDQFSTWGDTLKGNELGLMARIMRRLKWGPGAMDPNFRGAAGYLAGIILFDGNPRLPVPGGDNVVPLTQTGGRITPTRYRDLAKQIIAHYGRPDLWNTAGLESFDGAFAGIKVNWGELAREKQAEKYITELLPHMSDIYNPESFVSPSWPMGLYNTSAVQTMDGAFQDNKRFQYYIGGWDMTNVAVLDSMFRNSKFDGPIHEWEMPNLVSTEDMFNFNTNFNHPIDAWAAKIKLAGPDGARRGFDSDQMFWYAKAFAQPLPELIAKIINRDADVAATTTNMFYGATRFLTLAQKHREEYLGKGVFYLKKYGDGSKNLERRLVRGQSDEGMTQGGFSDAEPEDEDMDDADDEED